MTDGGGHSPHLPISTFVYGEFQPAIRYCFSGPDRGVTRPQVRGVDARRFGGSAVAILQGDALAQFLQFLLPGRAFHLNQVGLGQMETRVTDTRLQGTVISEQQQSFRIPVQPPGRVNAGHRDELSQGATTAVVTELG